MYTMKIYRRPITAATNAKELVSQLDNQFIRTIKQVTANMVHHSFHGNAKYKIIYDEILQYIVPKNMVVQITPSNGNSLVTMIIVEVAVKVPIATAIKYKIVDGIPSLHPFLGEVDDWVESNDLASNVVYARLFHEGIMNHSDDIETLKSRIIYAIESDDFSWILNDYYRDSELNHKEYSIEELKAFSEYCKARMESSEPTKSSQSPRWNNIVSELKSEVEDGINSIYDETEAGSYIDSIAQDVEDFLGIYSEPSIEGGRGSIFFYDKETNEELLEKDYDEYCEDIVDMALRSKSEKGFVSKLKKYYDI